MSVSIGVNGHGDQRGTQRSHIQLLMLHSSVVYRQLDGGGRGRQGNDACALSNCLDTAKPIKATAVSLATASVSVRSEGKI